MADEVEITISSHPRWLRLVRQVVCEYALETGFDAHDAHAITLAVGEAVGNIIKHSFPRPYRPVLRIADARRRTSR
ncbi:MAG: ATP-binding protein [Bryobacterales bacterium]